jgi:maltooligosyltrehalose trehalohydrolase
VNGSVEQDSLAIEGGGIPRTVASASDRSDASPPLPDQGPPAVKIGASYLGRGRCEFTVWAPFARDMIVQILSPTERSIPMIRDDWGYWRVVADHISPGTRYRYLLGEALTRPDPASHLQPEGVHGPSEVVDHTQFVWHDPDWRGISLEEMVIYELHVGTFTPEGTFAAIIPRIPDLLQIGVNTLQIMPVAQFPGNRNWGYDGTHLFAVQNSYGGPGGLKRLIDACHMQGMAVILDVIYNHFGPEGCYIQEFGPYFSEKYRVTWGRAINYDDYYSDQVRNFFIQNALHWLHTYHFDGLRLDAAHMMYDSGAKHILQELAEVFEECTKRYGRRCYLFSEGSIDDARYVRSRTLGGFGMNATWFDDFHHAITALVCPGRSGYESDFGRTAHLAKVLQDGYLFNWQYCPSLKRRIGSSSKDVPPSQLIAFIQNHDVAGNRPHGERLSHLVPFEVQKLAAGALLLSPYTPLLFMGEEYGEDAPFHYFTSFSDHQLIESIIDGRREAFCNFPSTEDLPDPQDPELFFRSKLDWEKRNKDRHRVLLQFYARLLSLRRVLPALACTDRACLSASDYEDERLILLHRWHGASQILSLFNFSRDAVRFSRSLPEGTWTKVLDSADAAWGGSGSLMPEQVEPEDELTISPLSFALYSHDAPR